MTEEFIVSLDIGTSKVRVIVAEASHDGTYHVIGVGTAKSNGMKRGAIIDIDQVVQSISQAIAEVERMVDMIITDVYVGFSGSHVALQSSQGAVAVSNENREIGYRDIERVLQAARVISLPPDREVIEIVAKQFVVDGFKGIKDPYGMVGIRLEVDATIVAGSKTLVHNITRCIHKAGLNLAGLVFLPIATGEFCLSEDEKNLGVVLIDIGGGKTTISFFYKGNLEFTSELPIGGDYITNDISVGFRTETEHAEELKCKYGVASAEFAVSTEELSIKTIGDGAERICSQLELAQIIEPRVIEMFQLIYSEMKEAKINLDPAGGYVLTGGVLSLPHLADMARKRLGKSVRISIPRDVAAKDPSYTGCLSMIHYLHRNNLKYRFSQSAKKTTKKKKNSILAWLKQWLNEII